MVLRDTNGDSLIVDGNADTGAPFSAEEQQDIEEELQVEGTDHKAHLSLRAERWSIACRLAAQLPAAVDDGRVLCYSLVAKT